MSRELKNIIDTIDEEDKSQTQLLTDIELLSEQLQRLKFTVQEQKQIINEQRSKLQRMRRDDVPEDIQILKELVISQRQELVKKEKYLEILSKNLEAMQINEQNILAEQKEQISELEQQLWQLNEDKREKIQLEEQLKIIKSQNLKLQEEFAKKDNIEQDKTQIDFLKEEIRRFQEVNDNLQEELFRTSEQLHTELEKKKVGMEKSSELEALKNRENDLLKKIEYLEKELGELENNEAQRDSSESKAELSSISDSSYDNFVLSINSDDAYQNKIILKLFSGSTQESKESFLNKLILDIEKSDVYVKKMIIELLGELKDQTAFKTLSQLVKDDNENWLVRHALVRALSRYNDRESTNLLKEFLRDKDVDVRELASRILKIRMKRE